MPKDKELEIGNMCCQHTSMLPAKNPHASAQNTHTKVFRIAFSTCNLHVRFHWQCRLHTCHLFFHILFNITFLQQTRFQLYNAHVYTSHMRFVSQFSCACACACALHWCEHILFVSILRYETHNVRDWIENVLKGMHRINSQFTNRYIIIMEQKQPKNNSNVRERECLLLSKCWPHTHRCIDLLHNPMAANIQCFILQTNDFRGGQRILFSIAIFMRNMHLTCVKSTRTHRERHTTKGSVVQCNLLELQIVLYLLNSHRERMNTHSTVYPVGSIRS